MNYLKEHYRTIVPFAIIFCVLLLSSGLVIIPIGSMWYYLIKFGAISLVIGLGIYFYSHKYMTSYLKLAIIIPFSTDYHLHYAFIVLTIILFNKKLLLPWNSIIKPIYILFIWCLFSYIVNQFVEINLLAFPLFIGTFFTPIITLPLFYIYANEQNKKQILLFFFSVIGIMCSIIILQTIIWWNLNPDLRTGGLTDVHMAGTFLSFAVFLLTTKKIEFVSNFNKTIRNVLILLFLLILFLIDAKYILFGLILVTISITIVRNFYKSKLTYTISILFLLVVSFLLYHFNAKIYLSVLSIEKQNFRVQNFIDNFNNMPRGKLLYAACRLPQNDINTFIFGAGPGTFMSRATEKRSIEKYNIWLREFDGPFKSISNIYRQAIIFKDTWIQKRYVDNEAQNKLYATSIFSNNGGLLSFYFELGIVGIIILLYFLFKISDIDNDPMKFVTSIVFFSLFIYAFGNWLEFPNYQLLFYALVGLNIKHKNFA